MSPLVSVVVINCDAARHLRQAVDSALGQTYPRIEVILVDGVEGSARGPRRVPGCRSVASTGPGEAASCNAGFAAATGDLVLFVDADDLLYPHAIEKVVETWRDGVVKVHFALEAADDRDRLVGTVVPTVAFAREEAVQRQLRRFGYYPAPPLTGNVFSREVLEQILPVDDEPLRRCVAAYLSAVAALYGRVRSIAAPLGACRRHRRAGPEAPTIDLAELRWTIGAELARERALKRHAEAIREPIPGKLSRRIPSHCKARLVSLLLDPENHPVQGDRVSSLVAAGIRAVLRYPFHGAGKRLYSALGFLALPLMPRWLLARRLDQLFLAERRPDLVGKALALVEAAAKPGRLARQPGR